MVGAAKDDLLVRENHLKGDGGSRKLAIKMPLSVTNSAMLVLGLKKGSQSVMW